MTDRKIKPLASLAATLTTRRELGQRVVLAHGVFDLLHLGHIRYLQEAKQAGDLLAVTLTPDRYVNKGPSRPAFTESQRAEALAALSCVDFVSINEQPDAVDAIWQLRPHLFAKHAECASDPSGNLRAETLAVRAAGGQLLLTEGEVFSSSALLNRYLPSVPPVAREWLSKFPHSAQEVNSWLDKAAQLTVLVAGEAITDEYIWVKALGKSGKEPILVVEELEREQHDGGATAVRKHVAAFAGKVEQWSAGEYLKKTRLVSRYPMQKMIELYSRLDTVLPDTRTLKLYDLVLVVDYGHGMIDSDGPVLAHDEEFLAVNVQNNAGNYGYNSHQKYERVDYLCLSESELRLAARQRNGDLRALVEKAAALHSAQAVTATRGDNGGLLHPRSARSPSARRIQGRPAAG